LIILVEIIDATRPIGGPMTSAEPAADTDLDAPRYASAVDTAAHGEYSIRRRLGDPRPLYRFTGRLAAGSRFEPEPGRYHLWSGWFCPWAQRSTIVIAHAGLQAVVSVSSVDNRRDGRGWAFREANGPDPVRGFTLLREAYELTEPGFEGHVSVPTLWDRRTGRVATNDYGTLDADLASAFLPWSTTGAQLYPEDRRDRIDALEARLRPAVNHGVHVATGDSPEATAAHATLLATLDELDADLHRDRFLLGDRLTLADVRLWVTLVRYDAGPNAGGALGPALDDYPGLWRYARELYALPAFRDTTRFGSFTRPAAVLPPWDPRRDSRRGSEPEPVS
jgi:putative glutathione S-transferase